MCADHRGDRLLVTTLRDYTRLVDGIHRTPQGWRYPTPAHLLLAQGRLFTPGPLPAGLLKMPGQFCFRNAALAARRHGLRYAEGMASFALDSGSLPTAHAWCVDVDGTAVDPTWPKGHGVAYLGIVIPESLWPGSDNIGVFDDLHRSSPVLRGELTPRDGADHGRPVPVPS
ncbi:hypothetical protein J2S43_001023 [Catenuloplanes nepalensis]|uniref:Uncharacterized protein n=1 Tax=Catenuloplanes nepalensis TaxID=587533 RepID=A0ABT9MMF1_9ACTN|nr:hypothetical protein [Catenuloplanes nepalensis]MDP9792511.1 hypothetical protein [Catenuloplanes nepalensis]